MSNIRDYNQGQGNPLWDFMSFFEPSGTYHPFASAYGDSSRERRGPPPGNVPPPPHHDGPANMEDPPEHSPDDFFFGAPFGGPHRHGAPPHHGHRRGRDGWRGRGGWGGRRSGGGFPMGGNFDLSKLGDFISQFVPEEVMAGAKDAANNNKSFTPPADLFDTEEAYVVHIPLPGAKKEDVGVNYDADNSELNVAGVIHRSGDEAFLKTLVLDERRKLGVFERKVKFGNKQNPANVDSDSITAKMEDGILMVTVPKVESFVEVKKVDIE